MGRTVRLWLISLAFLSIPIALGSQAKVTASEASPVIPMPVDRVADSYLIYSSLIPSGKDSPPQLLLVQDATIIAINPDKPCWVDPTVNTVQAVLDSLMNPHRSVHPPESSRQDFKEIMEDFDAHCHERLALRLSDWKPPTSVRLLTTEEQQELQTGVLKSAVPEKYRGGSALYGFSQVYFNSHHTVALVYATHWCGSLCGAGSWVPFALVDGHWKGLIWSTDHWIS